jgi:predicted outer membrane repeat protein
MGWLRDRKVDLGVDRDVRHGTMRAASRILLGALAATALAAPAAQAASAAPPCRVHNVKQGTSSHNFRVVVTLAHDGDELRVRGTCTTRGIAIDKDLLIRGMSDRATLDGQGRYRVLRIRKGAVVTLRNLVITHGVPVQYPYPNFSAMGGGISNQGALALVDSRVTENHAYGGGGIYNVGTLNLIRSTISGHGNINPLNDGGDPLEGPGGGIWNTGTATLVDSTVSDNHSEHGGGGIYSTGRLRLQGSTVSGNTTSAVSGDGGGITNLGALTMVDSRVTGNRAADGLGGGIFNGRRGSVSLRLGSSVTDNMSFRSGGGIFNRGTLAVRHSSVTGNIAGASGGGIRNTSTGTVVLDAAASVSDNTPDDCVGTPAC